jgi:phosphoglycerate dehydrogenase-like enzyme
MIGARELAVMKPSAFILNIGRGAVIDLEALTQSLRDGVVAGAGLDCFEVEPLPPEHPLWGMENVIITPHMAGQHTPHTRRTDIFLDNLARYLEGRPLFNIVDKADWH